MQNSPKCASINGKRLTQENIEAINAVLAMDQRVELIPTKDSIRVICVRREEVK